MKMIYETDHYVSTSMYNKDCRPSWEKAERLDYCEKEVKAKKNFLKNLFSRVA